MVNLKKSKPNKSISFSQAFSLLKELQHIQFMSKLVHVYVQYMTSYVVY